MAIYKYGEYFEAYPNRIRAKNIFDRFAKAEKNLHEMSIEEINAITSTWDKLAYTTVDKIRKEIKLYFDWLAESGLKVDLNVYKKMEIPTKANEYLVYTTDSLREYWELAFNALNRYATLKGRTFSRDTYLVNYAACLLSFYGMTTEQILGLDLYDVTEEGVKGCAYDIKPEDLEILLEYRNLRKLSNNMTLDGSKYVRSGRVAADAKITKDFLTASLQKADNMEEEYKYLKALLTDTAMFKLGKFCRAYEYEVKNNVAVDGQRNIPDWFINIMGEPKHNTLLKYKKEFIEYRQERKNAEINGKIAPKNFENKIEQPKIIEKIDKKVPEFYCLKGNDNVIKEEKQVSRISNTRSYGGSGKVAMSEDYLSVLTSQLANAIAAQQEINNNIMKIMSEIVELVKI